MVQTLKTRSESALQAKMKKQGGFTLAELLIVVAIIAILAAIAIPLYSAQMENARKRVDESTLSSATSMASTDYLINERTGPITYTVFTSKAGTGGTRNIVVMPGTEKPKDTTYTKYVCEATKSYSDLVIKIKDGGEIEESTLTATSTTP